MYLMTETLRGFDTLVRSSTTSAKGDNFCFPASLDTFTFEKGSTLKGKNLLPQGANSFLLE